MRYILILIFVAMLSACACQNCPPQNPYANVPCGECVAELEQRGVQVVQIGDTLRIILPADQFFEPASSKFRPQCEDIFETIAKLVICRCYWLLPISVKGYSDNVGPIYVQRRISLQQARNVAALLWANSIPISRIKIYGFGARGSIATNETNVGSYHNRRVEITLP